MSELSSSRLRYSTTNLRMAEKIVSNFKIDVNPDIKNAFIRLFDDIHRAGPGMGNILVRSNLLRNNTPRPIEGIPGNGSRRSIKTWIDEAYSDMLREWSGLSINKRDRYVNHLVFEFLNTMIRKLNLLISFRPPFIATPETIEEIQTLKGLFDATIIYFIYKFCHNVLLDNRFENKRHEGLMIGTSVELNMPRVPGEPPFRKKNLKSVDDIQLEILQMSLPTHIPTREGGKKNKKLYRRSK